MFWIKHFSFYEFLIFKIDFNRTILNDNGVKGEVTVHQRSPFEPTWLNFTVHSAKNELRENTEYLRELSGYQIRQLPPDPTLANTKTHCESAGPVYNPTDVEPHEIPPPGFGTQDQYPVNFIIYFLFGRNML